MSSDNETPIETVFIVSDGTGDTALKVVRAALRQFSSSAVGLRTFQRITTPSQLIECFEQAQQQQALVAITLVQQSMRREAEVLAMRYGVRLVDLLGPLLRHLETILHVSPSGVPGLLHKPDANYFKRIEAIEFTVRADDGKDPRMLRDADIILVGVSRTGKTPLSTFLAHQGFKVGNQPLVLDRPAPEQLFEADPQRVFALTIDPQTLQRIRRSRLLAMRMSEDTNYSDMGYIMAELEYAQQLYRGNGWPVIEVTNKAIEETAGTILGIMHSTGLLYRAEEGSGR